MKALRVVPFTLLLLTACAVRLGGPKPIEYDTLAVEFNAGTTPEQAAALIKEAGAELVLVAVPADSSWFAAVGQSTALIPTRVGTAQGFNLAFLTGKKAVGDTTLTLNVAGGGQLRVHDALYQIDKNRQIDLMTVVFEPNTNVREGVRTVLSYIATDVSSNVPVALAVRTRDRATADSVSLVTRAAWADSWECMKGFRDMGAPPMMNMRLFFFPSARIRCEDARVIDRPNAPVVARLIIGN